MQIFRYRDLESGRQPKTYPAGNAVDLRAAGPFDDNKPARLLMTLSAGTIVGTDAYGNAVNFGGVEFPAFTLLPVVMATLSASSTADVMVAW